MRSISPWAPSLGQPRGTEPPGFSSCVDRAEAMIRQMTSRVISSSTPSSRARAAAILTTWASLPGSMIGRFRTAFSRPTSMTRSRRSPMIRMSRSSISEILARIFSSSAAASSAEGAEDEGVVPFPEVGSNLGLPIKVKNGPSYSGLRERVKSERVSSAVPLSGEDRNSSPFLRRAAGRSFHG